MRGLECGLKVCRDRRVSALIHVLLDCGPVEHLTLNTTILSFLLTYLVYVSLFRIKRAAEVKITIVIVINGIIKLNETFLLHFHLSVKQ